MENEEHEDLLVAEITDDSETDSDYCIQDKIAHLLESNQNTQKTWSIRILLLASCLFLFLSSTVLLIVLPFYIEKTKKCGISTYSKIATLTTANASVFIILYAVMIAAKRCFPSWKSSVGLHMRLPRVLKLCCLLSVGWLSIFYIDNLQLVSCHLQDPLKGCVVVFSFAFYFIYSRRKISAEKVFCTITVIVGTFISVDFGLCDRYKCRGAEVHENPNQPTPFHAIYIIGYVVAVGACALHLTLLENSCRLCNYSSNLDVSIVSGESNREHSTSPIAQSLSIISGNRGSRQLSLSIPSAMPAVNFPVTSTPNEPNMSCVWDPCHWLLIQQCFVWIVVVLFSWLPTVSYFNEEPKLLVDVIEDVVKSMRSHVMDCDCPSLWLPSILVLISLVVFSICTVSVLCQSLSALTVACVCMNALPMAVIFWSVFQLDGSSQDLMTLNVNMTGETISAMLGFPIIGVGTFILIKAHVTQNIVHLRLR